jgi:hypothetical protein
VAPQFDSHELHLGYYNGYTIYRRGDLLRAFLAIDEHRELGGARKRPIRYVEARSMDEVRRRINADTPRAVRAALALARIFVFAWQLAYYAVRRAKLHRSLLGGWPPSAKGWLSEIYGRLHFRLTQFTVQRKAIVDSLANLVPNLRYVGRLARNRGEPASATIVVAETQLTTTYLKLLRSLGIIPRMRIERAESPEQVERAVTESAGPGGHGRLILTRNLYYSYYPFVAQFRRRGGVTIL